MLGRCHAGALPCTIVAMLGRCHAEVYPSLPELLFGKAGYLYALLFARRYVGDMVDFVPPLSAVAEALVAAGERLAQSRRYNTGSGAQWCLMVLPHHDRAHTQARMHGLTHVHVHTNARSLTHWLACSLGHRYAHMHVRTHSCARVCTPAHTCAQASHVGARTHMYTHVHA